MVPETKDLTSLLDLPPAEPVHEPVHESIHEMAPQLAPGLALDPLSTLPQPTFEAEPLASTENLPLPEDLAATEDLQPTEDFALTEDLPPPEKDDFDTSPLELAPEPPAASVEQVRQFAQSTPIGKPRVTPVYPFSLRISGKLRPEEKARLVDLLSRENMGIREVDLEPQLESGEILIPRISEYAGILLVQALRTAQADIRLAPADEIFQSQANLEDQERLHYGESSRTEKAEIRLNGNDSLSSHPAESLPISNGADLPGVPHYTVLDVLTASALLKSQIVDAERSSEYQDVVEALQRELRYKAYRKGASGIIHFRLELISLSLPTRYRVSVLGTAVQASQSGI